MLIGLIGLALGVAGVVALIAYGTGRDVDGYSTISTERSATPRYALVSQEVDLGAEVDAAGPVSLGDLARVRVRAEAIGGQAVFVGIGPRDDLRRYLASVSHDEVTHVGFDPFRATYRAHPGTLVPGPPAERAFWVARASGAGRRMLEWNLEGGRWSLVVMNAAAAPGVAADLSSA